MLNDDFYLGKKILVTGHTGFKGTWMCRVLNMLGADVVGYSLKPPTAVNLFELTHTASGIKSIEGDVRDLEALLKVFGREKPEIVIHMAAQPIVREAYKNPVYTYDVNVMGTVNVLECIRLSDSVRSFLNVTTDKVYKNREWEWGYRENEELNGYDPYSNSKSCSELVTESYKNSFFKDRPLAVSTARAGNVIGGGDFAADRIIPDCIRAAMAGENIVLRNPHSTRPYQHVLEPIAAYLKIVKAQYEDIRLSGNYNVGPGNSGCCDTQKLVEMFCDKWKEYTGRNVEWECRENPGPHEAAFLKLDCSKIKSRLGWNPKYDIESAVAETVEWYAEYFMGKDIEKCLDSQIQKYFSY